ncbi:MAG: cache domain-containing protein, partial [Lachnospiraceae bacterium]|nr:cache domain-containing protein [Lachnospiraceae bacterium]
IILIASALGLLMAGTVGFIGFRHIKSAYLDSFKEGLKAAAVLVDDELGRRFDGDWSLTDGGSLKKGSVAVHDIYQMQLDELHEKTGMDYTIFYGDTRFVTTLVDSATNERMEGTKASATVVSEVLNKGNDYVAENFELAGKNWYAYYIPLKNSDGTVVGMVFAGRDTSLVDANMKAAGIAIAVTFVGFFLFNWGVARYLISTSTKAIGDIVGSLQDLEEGKLSFYIKDRTYNRKDELGVIAASSAQVRDKLQDVISATKKLSEDVTQSGVNLANSAATASNVAEQVTAAVEDISRGAMSQAESVENSVTNTNEMGNSIDEITQKVDDLNVAALEMLNGANRTVETLNSLMSKNESVMASMQSIDAQIRLTNDSVKSISDATGLITAIADETHLLSLNASIEAARAGETGKGFAVVATEIGSLAAQSKTAADTIKKIVETLVSESQKSVDTIEELSESVEEQNKELTSTKDDMDTVVENVNNVEASTKMIADKIYMLNKLKTSFSEIISELSAISQQNAASTQETNASMEELNATFALISQAAADLREMAETLNEKMSFFTMENLSKGSDKEEKMTA